MFAKSFAILYVEDNARIVTEEKGVNDIVATMKKHMASPEVIEAAEAVLLALSMEGTCTYIYTYIHTPVYCI